MEEKILAGGWIYQTPTHYYISGRCRALKLRYNRCCFIMHEKGGNQLSVAAVVKRCGWREATLLNILPIYVSHSYSMGWLSWQAVHQLSKLIVLF